MNRLCTANNGVGKLGRQIDTYRLPETVLQKLVAYIRFNITNQHRFILPNRLTNSFPVLSNSNRSANIIFLRTAVYF